MFKTEYMMNSSASFQIIIFNLIFNEQVRQDHFRYMGIWITKEEEIEEDPWWNL
jgi:hypothetical protein